MLNKAIDTSLGKIHVEAGNGRIVISRAEPRDQIVSEIVSIVDDLDYQHLEMVMALVKGFRNAAERVRNEKQS